ncbi:MAG: FkbM family methyltransferase [Steroidobacteraceae bacterium]
MSLIHRLYLMFFGRRYFARFNRLLFMLGLRGMGVYNYQGASSGERWFVGNLIATDEVVTVFDVGANVGSYSSQILEFCRNAKVHAFEPHPLNFAKLAQVRGIESYNLALGNEEASLSLFDYQGAADGSQHASVFKEVIEGLHKGASTAHKVRCVRLDEFCKSKDIDSIDFLKIDTEGNELDVLRGAGALLQDGRIKVIQFEFNEMNVVSRVYMRDFVNLLSDYELFRLLPSGLLPLTYSPLLCELFAFQNIVAVAKSASLAPFGANLRRWKK